ncbi:MAG: hypothetical protein ACYTEV_08370 [Planctomycetota bacterium]|jgi:ribosomal protein L37AE/L43A
MFLYRIARITSETFPLVALGAYILAFLVVFPCVFLFPPLGLMLFGLSLASLPFTWVVGRGLIAAETRLALRELAAGACPQCAKRMQSIRDPERTWQCEFCEVRFRTDGGVIPPQMLEEAGPSPAIAGLDPEA